MNNKIQYIRNINIALHKAQWLMYENFALQTRNYKYVNRKLIHNLLVLLLQESHKKYMGYLLYPSVFNFTNVLELTACKRLNGHNVQYLTTMGERFIDTFVPNYRLSINKTKGSYLKKEFMYAVFRNQVLKSTFFKKPLLISKVFKMSKENKYMMSKARNKQGANIKQLNNKIHKLYKRAHERELILNMGNTIFPFKVDKTLNQGRTCTSTVLNILVKQAKRDAKRLCYGTGLLNKVTFLRFLTKNKIWKKSSNDLKGYMQLINTEHNLFVK